MSISMEDAELLWQLPLTLRGVPLDARRASADTLQQLTRIQRLKREGLLTATIEPTGPGYYNLHCLLTTAGGEATRRVSR